MSLSLCTLDIGNRSGKSSKTCLAFTTFQGEDSFSEQELPGSDAAPTGPATAHPRQPDSPTQGWRQEFQRPLKLFKELKKCTTWQK